MPLGYTNLGASVSYVRVQTFAWTIENLATRANGVASNNQWIDGWE
jgi:hypothetical protein